MSDAVGDYEKVSVYPLEDEDREALLVRHAECTFIWSTQDGYPLGVIMSYLWQDGRFWLTAGSHRHRISAVRRDPRVSIVVTSTGTELRSGKSITAKGHCIIHDDDETRAWFYPAFSQHLHKDEKMAKWFEAFLDSPLRIILEVVPEKWITYDGTKMALDSVGKLPPEQKGRPLESDTVRLEREMKRRGLTQD